TMRAHFYPTAGIELGKNLRGIIPTVDGQNIVRPKIGASALLIFGFGADALQSISFETTYVRRWPLVSEVTFKKATAGGFTSVDIGTDPRDYVKENLNLNL